MYGTAMVGLITLGITESVRFAREDSLIKLLSACIRVSGLEPTGSLKIQTYAPRAKGAATGMTLVQCLKESHATLETYPENGLAEVTISSCRRFSMDKLSTALEPYVWAKVVDLVTVKRRDGRWTLDEVMVDETR